MHGHSILAHIRSPYWSVASMFLSYGSKNLNVTLDAPTQIFVCNDGSVLGNVLAIHSCFNFLASDSFLFIQSFDK